MNRVDVLAQRRVLQAEKSRIIGAAMARFDVRMKGKSVPERQHALLHGTVYTEWEKRQLGELDAKTNGLTHMLREGFFQVKVTPEKDEEEEDLLY